MKTKSENPYIGIYHYTRILPILYGFMKVNIY